MGNSILNGGSVNATPNGNFIQQIMQFRSQYSGNPQQEVMKLLQQGRVSQEQVDRAMGIAQQLERMIPRG